MRSIPVFALDASGLDGGGRARRSRVRSIGVELGEVGQRLVMRSRSPRYALDRDRVAGACVARPTLAADPAYAAVSGSMPSMIADPLLSQQLAHVEVPLRRPGAGDAVPSMMSLAACIAR